MTVHPFHQQETAALQAAAAAATPGAAAADSGSQLRRTLSATPSGSLPPSASLPVSSSVPPGSADAAGAEQAPQARPAAPAAGMGAQPTDSGLTGDGGAAAGGAGGDKDAGASSRRQPGAATRGGEGSGKGASQPGQPPRKPGKRTLPLSPRAIAGPSAELDLHTHVFKHNLLMAHDVQENMLMGLRPSRLCAEPSHEPKQ